MRRGEYRPTTIEKLSKLWLTTEQTEAILKVAKSHRERDYLILTCCRYGLRDGEILGRGRLPGIFNRDLRESGVWLVGKGYSHEGEAPSLYPLPLSFMRELIAFSVKEGRGPNRKVFDVGVRRLEQAIKEYAKEAGLADWKKVKPHRLRAFLATDAKRKGIDGFSIRDLMRHADIRTTNLYVGKASVEERAVMIERLATGSSDMGKP